MSQISRKVRIRPAERKTAALARTEFKARLKARMIKGEGPDEVLDPEIFEDWDDAADLLKHFKTAPVHNVKRSDLAGTRKRAKPRARTTVRARGQTRAREKARRKTRKTTKGAVMLPHNTGLLPPIVRPINPPPKRYIGVRFIQPEVDTTKAKFRRQRIGIGKCTGGKLKGRHPRLFLRLRDAGMRQVRDSRDEAQPGRCAHPLARVAGIQGGLSRLLVRQGLQPNNAAQDRRHADRVVESIPRRVPQPTTGLHPLQVEERCGRRPGPAHREKYDRALPALLRHAASAPVGDDAARDGASLRIAAEAAGRAARPLQWWLEQRQEHVLS